MPVSGEQNFVLLGLPVWFLHCLSSLSRHFHLHGDVITAYKGLPLRLTTIEQ